jgi:hypothetical protein
MSGLTNMKFGINHQYRFRSLSRAFLAGLLQAISATVIEWTNLLCILTSNNAFDIVQNFMALTIIA